MFLYKVASRGPPNGLNKYFDRTPIAHLKSQGNLVNADPPTTKAGKVAKLNKIWRYSAIIEALCSL